MVLLPRSLPRPPDVDMRLVRRISKFVLRPLKSYFRARVEGLSQIPPGRALLVGVHNGGHLPLESVIVAGEFYRHFEYERPLHFLAHRMLWKMPPDWIQVVEGIGIVNANHLNGEALLEAERAVMVYPGGAYEVYRPFWERNRIDWNGHMGYVRLAVRTRTPIVPVPSVGGHEVFIGLSRGEWLNRLVGLSRWLKGVNVLPVLWGFPFGPSLAFLPPFLPLPAQITARALEPLELHNLAAGRALFRRDPKGDPEHLRTLHRLVQKRMQAGMDDLAKGRVPVLGKLNSSELWG